MLKINVRSIGVAFMAVSIHLVAHGKGPQSPPSWFEEDVQYMTRDGGRWVADNRQYKSEQESWDSYVIEWRAGPGNASMSARMYALKAGKPSEGDFWNFFQYWDPASGTAMVQQSGWGSFGTGEMQRAVNGFSMEQTFTTFDGESSVQGHIIERLSDVSHKTQSYSYDDKGNKVDGRTYVWKRSK